MVEDSLPDILGAFAFARVNGDRNLQFPRQRERRGMRRGREVQFITGQIDAANPAIPVLVSEFHRLHTLADRCGPVTTQDQPAEHAEIALPAAQSFEGGDDGVLHRKAFVAGETWREAGFEVNDIVAGAIFAEFIRNSLLCFGERKNRVEDLNRFR